MKLTIGADPEFGLLSRGALVYAENAIPGRGRGSTHRFGVDGSGRPVEIRPEPSDNPLGLVRNVRRALASGISDFPDLKNYKWKAGSMAFTDPIGGHIHFGHSSLRNNVSLCEAITNLLNKTLAPCGVLIENQKEARLRRLGSIYGSIIEGACRMQPWGFEYRVLSSWLVSPRIAGGILAIAYTLTYDLLEDPNFRKAVENLPNVNVTDISYPDKLSLAVMMPDIVKLIRNTKHYTKLQTYIETIFTLIAFQKDWNCDRDMKKTWNLCKTAEEPVAVAAPPSEVRSRHANRDSRGRFASGVSQHSMRAT